MGKEIRINVRANELLKRRIQTVTETTKIAETSLVIACMEALCDYFDEHGEITMPLIVKPKSAEAPLRQDKRRTARSSPFC